MASLQDQLLKAGIVDKKKAKEIKKEQRKKAKQTPKGSQPVDEAREQAKQALAEKSRRGRELNKQQQAEADRKAIFAQIIQLIKMNRIARTGGEIAYQFTDGKKIKKLYVTAEQQNQLTRGQLAIVTLDEAYELVPAVVAEKIKQRDSKPIVLLHSPGDTEVEDDDPYADYQIPDDLMW